MLYSACPTCGTLLADKQLDYEEKLKKICDNPKLSQEDKDKQKMELINSMGLERYCCKMKLMTYVDLIKIVI